MTTQQTPQKRRITFIPPDPKLTERDIRKKHLRVAPYCRVSTDSEEQLNSYNAQIAYYTEKIAAMRSGPWSACTLTRASQARP